MEGSHGQLRTGLTDRLCRDDTHGLTDLYRLTGCKVSTVAVCAHTVLGVTLNDRSDIYLLDARSSDCLCVLLGDHGIVVHDDLAADGIDHGTDGVSAHDSVSQRLENVLILFVDDLADPCTLGGIALVLANDHFLGYVNQTAGQVTGVCGTQCGIRQRLTGGTCAHEVLHDVQTFTEVGLDRQLHGLTVGCKHQTTHTCQLTHLGHRTSRAGVCHDLDGVIGTEAVLQCLGNVVGGLVPDLDNAVVAFLVGKLTAQIVLGQNVHVLLCTLQHTLLFLRNGHIVNRD